MEDFDKKIEQLVSRGTWARDINIHLKNLRNVEARIGNGLAVEIGIEGLNLHCVIRKHHYDDILSIIQKSIKEDEATIKDLLKEDKDNGNN